MGLPLSFTALTFRIYEDHDKNAVYNDEESETSSIIRIRKQDGERSPTFTFQTERADTVLYLKEINKYVRVPFVSPDC
jgi:hypothetical protein